MLTGMTWMIGMSGVNRMTEMTGITRMSGVSGVRRVTSPTRIN